TGVQTCALPIYCRDVDPLAVEPDLVLVHPARRDALVVTIEVRVVQRAQLVVAEPVRALQAEGPLARRGLVAEREETVVDEMIVVMAGAEFEDVMIRKWSAAAVDEVVDCADVELLPAGVSVGGAELQEASPPGRTDALFREGAGVGRDVPIRDAMRVELRLFDLQVRAVVTGDGSHADLVRQRRRPA